MKLGQKTLRSRRPPLGNASKPHTTKQETIPSPSEVSRPGNSDAIPIRRREHPVPSDVSPTHRQDAEHCRQEERLKPIPPGTGIPFPSAADSIRCRRELRVCISRTSVSARRPTGTPCGGVNNPLGTAGGGDSGRAVTGRLVMRLGAEEPMGALQQHPEAVASDWKEAHPIRLPISYKHLRLQHFKQTSLA